MTADPLPTRFRRRKQAVIVALLVVLCFLGWQRRWLTINDVTTGETAAYPELKPRVYATDVPATQRAALEACGALPRWRVREPAPDAQGAIQAEAQTLLRFTDDVTIRFEALAGGATARTRVVIRSRSRAGRGDMGTNARHIAELQSAMDARLPLAR
jgi:uncharacterized protein (DUF1499 family)